MAQELPRFCPRCGTPTTPGHIICARCGLYLLQPPSQQSGPQRPEYTDAMQGQSAYAPGMANPRQGTPAQPAPPWQSAQQSQQPVSVDEQSAPAWTQSPAQPQYPQQPQQPRRTTGGNSFPGPTFNTTPVARRRGLGRMGWIVIVLLVVIVIGAVGYLALSLSGAHVPGSGTKSNTQSTITTTTLNETVTYAGVNVTVLNAQQAQNFLDDPNSSTDGMVRLTVQEQNPTAVKVSWLYNDIASLVLPGGKTVTPTYVKANVGIAPGATQKSIVDFAVPATDKLSQLTLHLGSTNEAQMAIPLVSNANLSKYAPVTVKPGRQLQYLGLNWTLVSATAQYSIAGQQASKNMRYVVVTLSVDSTLSQEVISGSAFSYIQLQAGNVTYNPVDTTLPVSFAAGETGKTGTVTFLASQQSTSYTLMLIPSDQSGATEATTNFQLS